MAKEKKNNSKRKEAITGLWHSGYMVSKTPLEVYEISITGCANPTEDNVGAMGTKWRVDSGEWEGFWYYRPVQGSFMTAEEQREFLETLFVWPEYNNPYQGMWTIKSATILLNKNRRDWNSKFEEFYLDFADKDMAEKTLSNFLEAYSECDLKNTIVNIVIYYAHDGEGNPNGDPANDNCPRQLPDGRLWVSNVAMHNKVRQVLREQEIDTYIKPGRSIKTTEELEQFVCIKQDEFRKTALDAKWFGATRAVS